MDVNLQKLVTEFYLVFFPAGHRRVSATMADDEPTDTGAATEPAAEPVAAAAPTHYRFPESGKFGAFLVLHLSMHLSSFVLTTARLPQRAVVVTFKPTGSAPRLTDKFSKIKCKPTALFDVCTSSSGVPSFPVASC